MENTLFRKTVFTVIMVLVFSFILFPIVWMLLTSFKMDRDAITIPPKWLFTPTLKHYHEALIGRNFVHYFTNSLVIAIGSVAIVLLIGIPTAYAIVRFNFSHKEDLAFWILSSRMAPPITFLIPFFILFRTVGLTDTRIGLIILHITINLALVVWMLRAFFQEIPIELEDAGLVDGCTRWQAFMRITLPLSTPGILATAILSLIFSWNELMFGTIIAGRNAKTLPVAMYNFIGYLEVKWGGMCATGIIALIPIFVLLAFVQKYLVRGLTFGALKK